MAQTRYATVEDLGSIGLKSIQEDIDSEVLALADVELALDAASSEAEGYLSTRYKPPFTSWPLSLRLHVARIAGFLVLTRTGYQPGAESNELILQGYEMAITWLRRVSSGEVTLPLHTTSPSAARVPQVYSDPDDRGWGRL